MKTTMKVMAALLIMLTASVSVKAQVFEKVNDSLYMLRDFTCPGRDSVVRSRIWHTATNLVKTSIIIILP